jgi:hypothetical protein
VGTLLVVTCCLAHGLNMTPLVHSEVFSSIVDMLPGGVFSSYLPYCCLLLVGSIVLISCCVSSVLESVDLHGQYEFMALCPSIVPLCSRC